MPQSSPLVWKCLRVLFVIVPLSIAITGAWHLIKEYRFLASACKAPRRS